MTCKEGYCRPDDPMACAEPPTQYAQVTVGAFHACAISTYNDLQCWGSNTRGQLGLGSSIDEVLQATRVDGAKWETISAGALHTCGLRRGDSAVYCWGENADGQTKGEKGTQFVTPTKVTMDPMATPPLFTQLSAGSRHTCALGEGQIWCWGHEQQVGIAATYATRIDKTITWSAVSAGVDHTCAISDSKLFCWGENIYGAIDDTRVSSPTPIAVDVGGLYVIAVTAGDQNTCAIASATAGAPTGELWCWGRNDRRLLDDTAVHSGIPRRLGVIDSWSSIELSYDVNCGVHAGGLTCWGRSALGGLGTGLWLDDRTIATAALLGPSEQIALSTRTSASAFLDFGCSRNAGAIACWGANPHGELGLGMASRRTKPVLVAPPMNATWTALWAGDDHTCAATSANELHCWGGDQYSQISAGIARGLTNPCLATEPCNHARPVKAHPDITRFDDIVAGNTYSCMRDGATIKCWGTSQEGSLGAAVDRGFATVLAPTGSQWTKLWGGTRGNCALTTMGRVACWGYFARAFVNRPQVQMSTEVHDIGDARFGDDVLCMVRTSDNSRVCWGRNESGQMGDGTNVDVTMPTPVDVSMIDSLSVYAAHACAITTTGGVACWGTNATGESNMTGTQPVFLPKAVEDENGLLTGCTKTSVGREHSCAVCGGRVLCWGQDANGATGQPDTTSPDHVPTVVDVAGETFVDIASREYGACALTSSGKIYCWGDSTYGSNGDGGQSRNLPTDITTRF